DRAPRFDSPSLGIARVPLRRSGAQRRRAPEGDVASAVRRCHSASEHSRYWRSLVVGRKSSREDAILRHLRRPLGRALLRRRVKRGATEGTNDELPFPHPGWTRAGYDASQWERFADWSAKQ